MTQESPPQQRVQTKFRTLTGVGIGNTFEWYDWSVYAIFAPFFASQFFISNNPTAALLSTLAIFAAGFVMRPLGGFLFGWLADRYGRKFSLMSSMILMALGSILIGVSPTHSTIGIWAAVILLLARLLQGLATGGEIAAAYTYIAEVAPRAKRGLWSSSLYISMTIGIMLAALFGAAGSSIFGPAALTEWAWRVPFLFGGVLGIVALIMRRSLQETEAFGSEAEEEHRRRTMGKLLRDLMQHKASLLRVMGLTLGVTVIYYTWAVGIPGFAISSKAMEPSSALWASVAANVVFMISLPLWGKLSDRVGRKPLLITYGIAFIVLSVPMILMINNSPLVLFLIMTVALVFLGSFVAILPACFAELFPAKVRASGIGIPYSFIVAIFGGTAPLLLTWLNSINLLLVFGIYMAVLAAVLLVTTILTPETRGIDLT